MLLRQRKPPTPTGVAALPISVMAPRYTRIRSLTPAVLIPGDSVLESTTVGGTVTFFSIYQNVLIARILLSWFPGVQGSPLIRPLITVCDPYLSLFRRAVPPVFGLDLSPVLALFLLQALGSVCSNFLVTNLSLTSSSPFSLFCQGTHLFAQSVTNILDLRIRYTLRDILGYRCSRRRRKPFAISATPSRQSYSVAVAA